MDQAPFMSSELYKRQIVRRILLILGTCGLIYWLQGGIPPTSLTLLVQTYQSLNTLWANKGPNVLLLPVLLTAQVLCVGVAWGFLLWLLVREFRALLPGNTSHATAMVPSTQHMAKAMGSQSSSFPATISARPNAQSPVYQSSPYSDMQSLAVPQHYQPVAQLPSPPLDPQERGKPDLVEPQSPQPDKTFLPGMPSTGDSQDQAASTGFFAEDEEDGPFIFGNPFEGPVPDIFHHDQDLRKSLMEQPAQAIDTSIEQTKPKKKR